MPRIFFILRKLLPLVQLPSTPSYKFEHPPIPLSTLCYSKSCTILPYPSHVPRIPQPTQFKVPGHNSSWSCVVFASTWLIFEYWRDYVWQLTVWDILQYFLPMYMIGSAILKCSAWGVSLSPLQYAQNVYTIEVASAYYENNFIIIIVIKLNED